MMKTVNNMKKNKILLTKIKYNASRLLINHQLPKYLVQLVLNLDENSDINYIRLLMYHCESCMRVKGYYKKYPQYEKIITEELKKQLGA